MALETRWRKSIRSQNGANCVEVSSTLDQLRDSKNPSGPVLRGSIASLVLTIRSGQLDK